MARMWFGCGSDVAQMWLGRGSDVARMWLGHVFGCLAESPAEVKEGNGRSFIQSWH